MRALFYIHTHTHTNLQVVIGWNLFLQKHLSQHFIGVSHTLHQLLPATCRLGAEIRRDLIIADSLTARRSESYC